MGVVYETASANGTSMKVPRNAILALILEGCIHTALANAEILADRLDVELVYMMKDRDACFDRSQNDVWRHRDGRG